VVWKEGLGARGSLKWATGVLLAAGGALALRSRAFRTEIAARVAAESAARRFEELVQGLDAVVWEADPRTLSLTFVSDYASEMLGHPVARWIEEPDFWENLIHPDDRDTATAVRRRILAGHGHELEYRVVAADGRVLWVRDVVHVVRDESGEPRRLRGVMVDISDRIEAEERLRTAEQNALQSEKLRALGQMATGIAHDLNQSLALVAGYSELARRGLEKQPPDLDALREALAVVAQAAHDGGETLRRLLAFSRNRVEGVAERVDMSALLREVARLTAPAWRDAPEAEGRHISLHVEASGDTAIQGWPAGLRETLTNLVFNAVDAMPRGGTIRLSAHRAGDDVVVECADSGVGMPADVQARVFEPFFTTKGEKGTGLGLSMVFAIAKQHGGDVTVDSVEGRGTTFRLRLPAALDHAQRQRARDPENGGDAAPRRALRILAVDDQPALAQMIQHMLEPEGHAVVTCGSGEEALGLLAEGQFDVVVSDVGMGSGMNGFELAERIRRDWPSVRIVLATGWGSLLDMEDVEKRGVDAIVSKPYRLAELRKAVDVGLGSPT
jgi:PAS domain S-box-containing protein